MQGVCSAAKWIIFSNQKIHKTHKTHKTLYHFPKIRRSFKIIARYIDDLIILWEAYK